MDRFAGAFPAKLWAAVPAAGRFLFDSEAEPKRNPVADFGPGKPGRAV